MKNDTMVPSVEVTDVIHWGQGDGNAMHFGLNDHTDWDKHCFGWTHGSTCKLFFCIDQNKNELMKTINDKKPDIIIPERFKNHKNKIPDPNKLFKPEFKVISIKSNFKKNNLMDSKYLVKLDNVS